MKLSSPAFTRITLALDIIGKIPSGPYKDFHELSIIKHRIGLFDDLTIEDSPRTAIRCKSPFVPRDARNICWKAIDLMRERFHLGKHAIISIKKNIPVRGGLAGGSADGAATLALLNNLWGLGLSAKELMDLGREIGMDVPYYFLGGTAFDTEGTGVLEPVPTDLSFDFVLVIPDFGVSTKEAYANIDYGRIGKNTAKTAAMRGAFSRNDRAGVAANMHNDFEASVFKRYPALGEIKQRLIDLGCENAVMSGSGSTIVGLLRPSVNMDKIRRDLGYTALTVSSKPGCLSLT